MGMNPPPPSGRPKPNPPPPPPRGVYRTGPGPAQPTPPRGGSGVVEPQAELARDAIMGISRTNKPPTTNPPTALSTQPERIKMVEVCCSFCGAKKLEPDFQLTTNCPQCGGARK